MSVWTVMIGMMLVTYIPRYLPFRFVDSERVPRVLRIFLQQMPYAALGALILPGVFGSTGQNHLPAVLAAVVCTLVAAVTRSVVASLVAAVGTAAALLAVVS